MEKEIKNFAVINNFRTEETGYFWGNYTIDEIVEELLEHHLPMDWQIYCDNGKEYHLFGDKLFPVNQ